MIFSKGIITVKFGVRNAARARPHDAYKAKQIYYNRAIFDIRECYNDIGLIEVEFYFTVGVLFRPILKKICS